MWTRVKSRATKIRKTIFVYVFACMFSLHKDSCIIRDSTQAINFLDDFSDASTFQRVYSCERMLQKTLGQTCFVYVHFQVDSLTLKKFYFNCQCFLFYQHFHLVSIFSGFLWSVEWKSNVFGWFLQSFFVSITVAVLFVSFCNTLLMCIYSKSWTFAKFLSNLHVFFSFLQFTAFALMSCFNFLKFF